MLFSLLLLPSIMRCSLTAAQTRAKQHRRSQEREVLGPHVALRRRPVWCAALLENISICARLFASHNKERPLVVRKDRERATVTCSHSSIACTQYLQTGNWNSEHGMFLPDVLPRDAATATLLDAGFEPRCLFCLRLRKLLMHRSKSSRAKRKISGVQFRINSWCSRVSVPNKLHCSNDCFPKSTLEL